MPQAVVDVSKDAYSAVLKPFEAIAHSAKDLFTPQMPEAPEQPAPADPAVQRAGLKTGQAAERSLLKRKGLAATKRVRNSLGGGTNLGG